MGNLQRETHEALTATDGNRRAAAAKLGCTLETIQDRIQASEELRALWMEAKPVSESEVLDGPKPLPPEDPEMENRVESVADKAQREDREFRLTLAHLGEVPDDVVRAMAFNQMFKTKMRMCIDTIGGGVTHRAIRMTKVLDRLETELMNCLDSDEATKKGETFAERLQIIGVLYTESTKALGGLMDRSTHAMAVKGKIAMYENTVASGKQKGKPGFGTKQALTA